MKGDGHAETVGIPARLRAEVDQRDQGHCRMCGRHLGPRRAIHHIYYGGDVQGMGGRRHHVLDNLVSLCWQPGDSGCHDRAHSAKTLWQPLLAAAITSPTNVTAFQLYRRTPRA